MSGTGNKTSLLQQCKDRLSKYYGDRLAGVVLYGSFARDEATVASDFDLLVLLRPPSITSRNFAPWSTFYILCRLIRTF